MKPQPSFTVFFLAGTIMLATSLILLFLYYTSGGAFNFLDLNQLVYFLIPRPQLTVLEWILYISMISTVVFYYRAFKHARKAK